MCASHEDSRGSALPRLARTTQTVWADLTGLGRNAQGYEEFRHDADGSVLILIPGATFTMGSHTGRDNEKPATRITMSPYFIGKYTVTNAQFACFVAATGYKTHAERNGGGWVWVGCGEEQWPEATWRSPNGAGRLGGEQMPVVQISWSDARAYVQWCALRLPTEAEWEFAARGEKSLEYPWGNTWDASRCCNGVGETTADAPRPVGRYPSGASPFGCMGMSGNVWQWCSSKYRPYPYHKTDGREEPSGSDWRVLRGGTWLSSTPEQFKAAYRLFNPDFPYVVSSFRVARSV